ncbi:helix-turn-helix domain-containing protein [Propionivibrio sp.]|uniref:helix-turn-helix domain-containing protein n=1 Tax=Propionivibrio sp. TaxID=2212460 RepID=UPI003BF373AA
MNIAQIRDVLISRRKERGATQEKVAKSAKLSREMISRLENDAHDIGLRRLLRLCDALDLELIIRPGRGRPTLEDLGELFKDDE